MILLFSMGAFSVLHRNWNVSTYLLFNEIQYFMENRSAFLDFKKYYKFSSLLMPLHPFYINNLYILITDE